MRGLFIIICMLLLVSGCSVVDRIVTPKPWGLGDTPEGSEIFQKGWNDGCNSGLHVYGTARYRAAYDYYQDPELLENQEYYRAWKDAWTYCRWYAWNWVRPFSK